MRRAWRSPSSPRPGFVLLADPAAADPAEPGDVRSEVTAITPATDGVTAEVVGGDSFLRLRGGARPGGRGARLWERAVPAHRRRRHRRGQRPFPGPLAQRGSLRPPWISRPTSTPRPRRRGGSSGATGRRPGTTTGSTAWPRPAGPGGAGLAGSPDRRRPGPSPSRAATATCRPRRRGRGGRVAAVLARRSASPGHARASPPPGSSVAGGLVIVVGSRLAAAAGGRRPGRDGDRARCDGGGPRPRRPRAATAAHSAGRVRGRGRGCPRGLGPSPDSTSSPTACSSPTRRPGSTVSACRRPSGWASPRSSWACAAVLATGPWPGDQLAPAQLGGYQPPGTSASASGGPHDPRS